MALSLPRLPVGVQPDQLQYYWQLLCEAIEEAYNDLEAVNETQQATIDALVAVNNAVIAADAAAAAAQAAADSANAAAVTANDTIAQIEAGTLELDAVLIGGDRFINDGGVLVPEP